MPSTAKLIIAIKHRKTEQRHSIRFFVPSIFFFKVALFFSFLPFFFFSFFLNASNSLLPASTTSFHQGPLGFSLPASSALFIDIFNNSEKSYFKCTGQNSPPGLKNKSCHVWQTATHRRQTSNIYTQICKFKESIDTAYSLCSFFIGK